MKPFHQHTGIVAPIDRSNIDTDAIIPKQFLRRIERKGFGRYLFFDWRYIDGDEDQKNPEFILNQSGYEKATILLARDNFGCGSSREHAPWALMDYGFRAIIAPSFADIFYNNCIRNGLLPVILSRKEVNALFLEVNNQPLAKITIDLKNQKVISPAKESFSFDIQPFAKECLIKGLDAIGWTLQFQSKIRDFEKNHQHQMPWLFS